MQGVKAAAMVGAEGMMIIVLFGMRCDAMRWIREDHVVRFECAWRAVLVVPLRRFGAVSKEAPWYVRATLFVCQVDTAWYQVNYVSRWSSSDVVSLCLGPEGYV
jgi:hypothetical protein